MIRCNQIAVFEDVNLPFNLIVIAKTSAPEQFERAILEAMLKAWAHSMTSLRTRKTCGSARISSRQHAKWSNAL